MSLNPFESGRRKVIPAVLVYLRSGDHVLMLHRNIANKVDHHEGKWNGLGGKCELDESPLEAARRETFEESGIDIELEKFRPMGVLQFPNFKSDKSEDWMVFLFTADLPNQIAVKKSPEGDLHWVPEFEILSLNLWAGDREFLPRLLAGRPFVGTIWYQGETVTKSWLSPLN